MIDGMKISLSDADVTKLKNNVAAIDIIRSTNCMQLYKVYSNGIANKAYLLFYSGSGTTATPYKMIVKTISLMNIDDDLMYNYDVTIDTMTIS